MRATEMDHMKRFIARPMWRNFCEGEVAAALHMVAWLLIPTQMLNEEIGN